MAQKQHALEVVYGDGLTDADWDAINKVRRAYDSGGWDAFWGELETLGDDDFVLQFRIARAFFPDVIRAAFKDELAESGITLDDLRELLRKAENRSTEH